MKKPGLLLFFLAATGCAATGTEGQDEGASATYAGSATCAECHSAEYAAWQRAAEACTPAHPHERRVQQRCAERAGELRAAVAASVAASTPTTAAGVRRREMIIMIFP